MKTKTSTALEKRWLIHPQQETLAQKIGEALSVSSVTAQLLLNRDIRSLKEAQAFINPTSIQSTTFPDADFDGFASLLKTLIQDQKHIFIYGDYDVDGMTSTAILKDVLESWGAKVSFYLPNRFTDGYGLPKTIVQKLSHHKAECLITLDCGISNLDEIKEIKESYPIPIVIMDHHNIPEENPPADFIFNPKIFPEDHALSGLCTAGIVYHVLQKIADQFKPDLPIQQYLDLVAIGTVADIAPLKGMNRKYVFDGLALLNKRKRKGLQELLDLAEFNRSEITTRDIGFTIGPRLNAAGRLGFPKPGVDILMSKDNDEAKSIAKKLHTMNNERRVINEDLMKMCEDNLEEAFDPTLPVILLAGKGWHSGVIGITAARIAEAYARPTIMVSFDETIGRGSVRSFGDINIYHILKECQDHFETFGGHKSAAGFSITEENLIPFKEKLMTVAAEKITPKDLLPILDVDMPLPVDHINITQALEIAMLNPFGEENPQPVFYTDELKAIDIRTVGDGTHIKCRFTDTNEKIVIDAIGFRLSDKMELLYKPNPKLAFNLDINCWQGKEECQLVLLDIK